MDRSLHFRVALYLLGLMVGTYSRRGAFYKTADTAGLAVVRDVPLNFVPVHSGLTGLAPSGPGNSATAHRFPQMKTSTVQRIRHALIPYDNERFGFHSLRKSGPNAHAGSKSNEGDAGSSHNQEEVIDAGLDINQELYDRELQELFITIREAEAANDATFNTRLGSMNRAAVTIQSDTMNKRLGSMNPELITDSPKQRLGSMKPEIITDSPVTNFVSRVDTANIHPQSLRFLIKDTGLYRTLRYSGLVEKDDVMIEASTSSWSSNRKAGVELKPSDQVIEALWTATLIVKRLQAPTWLLAAFGAKRRDARERARQNFLKRTVKIEAMSSFYVNAQGEIFKHVIEEINLLVNGKRMDSHKLNYFLDLIDNLPNPRRPSL